MSARRDLLASISQTILDFRAGNVEERTPDHVDRWVSQFDKDAQDPMLRELDHVLKKTYLNRATVREFLRSMIRSKNLAGTNPAAFWSRTHFLNIQTSGHSQREMLETVDALLLEECNTSVADCGKAGGEYVYVDDVMFSGNRVGNDLSAWIAKEAPAMAVVHVVVAAMHTSGEYLVGKRLEQAIAASGKCIRLKYWRIVTVENRKYYKNDSEVLWPAELPADAATREYLALPHKFPLELRKPGGRLGPFSSEEGRRLLERELLIAGVRIRGLSQSPKDILRPLGFSPFGVGFGSLTVTYRNCPNNCPLALWWGDPDATSGPFNWFPLVPRRTYAQAVDIDALDF